jgi:PilZ domain
MGESDHRQITRDSLFVMADLMVDGAPAAQRVKVRNVSSGGLMAEGATAISRGQLLRVDLRNIGWVEGSVAWVQGARCGIAFREEIDPKVTRMANGGSSGGDSEPPYVVRRPAGALGTAPAPGLLRKV